MNRSKSSYKKKKNSKENAELTGQQHPLVAAMVCMLGAAAVGKERDLQSERPKIKLVLYNNSLNWEDVIHLNFADSLKDQSQEK